MKMMSSDQRLGVRLIEEEVMGISSGENPEPSSCQYRLFREEHFIKVIQHINLQNKNYLLTLDTNLFTNVPQKGSYRS
jgi:hypothetical protein